MNEKKTINPELAFLLEQQHLLDRRIGRWQDTLESTDDPLEAKGVKALLQAAQLQRDLLTDLIQRYVDLKPLSLESILLEAIEENQHAAQRARLDLRWQPGQPTPQEFWNAEIKHAFLKDILQHYHDFQQGRSLYSAVDQIQKRRKTAPFALPWYPEVEDDTSEAPHRQRAADLEKTIQAALEPSHYPDHHLTVVAESDGFVLVTGYAHNTRERENIIETILKVDGVREVLASILVNAPEHCLVCKTQQAGTAAS